MNIHIAALAFSLAASCTVAQTQIGDPETAPPEPVEYPVLDPYLVLDPAFGEDNRSTWFGSSVVIRGDELLVSAPDWDLVDSYENTDHDRIRSRGTVGVYNLLSGQGLRSLEPSTSVDYQRFGSLLGSTQEYTWASSWIGSLDIYDEVGMPVGVLSPSPELTGSHMASAGISDRVIAVHRVSGSEKGISVLYDLATSDELARFESNAEFLVDARTALVFMDEELIAVRNARPPNDKRWWSSGFIDIYNTKTFEHEFSIEPKNPSQTFGTSVSMNSRYIAIASAKGHGFDSDVPNGGVELYDRETGELVWRFIPGDTDRIWSNSIAMNERFVAVGSIWKGSVYLIDIENPARTYRLGDMGYPMGHYRFGASISMNDDMLVVGAPAYEHDDGRVYIYNLGCRADLNADSVYNGSDFAEFIRLFSSLDPSVDLNSDGKYNYTDISIYIRLFQQGCF